MSLPERGWGHWGWRGEEGVLDTSQWEPRINVKEGGGGWGRGTYVHHKVSVLVSSTQRTTSFLQLTRSSLRPHPQCLFTTTGSQGSFLTKYCLVEIRSHCFLWEGGLLGFTPIGDALEPMSALFFHKPSLAKDSTINKPSLWEPAGR